MPVYTVNKAEKGPKPRPAANRFWEKVSYDGPLLSPYAGRCWTWTAAIRRDGYGVFSRGSGPEGVMPAHRFAYEEIVGPIPAGCTIDHLCRVRACVNPAHLEAVSSRENILRGNGFTARSARKRRCVNHHPFDGVDRNGYRTCSICAEMRRHRKGN
jgi:hypothetical protein